MMKLRRIEKHLTERSVSAESGQVRMRSRFPSELILSNVFLGGHGSGVRRAPLSAVKVLALSRNSGGTAVC